MVPEKDRPWWQSKFVMAGFVVLLVIALLSIFTDVLDKIKTAALLQFVGFFAILIILAAIMAMLPRVFKIADQSADNGAKLDRIAEALEKSRTVLSQINVNTRLSEKAKSIAFSENDRQSLREAVFDKMQQKDFDGTYELIDEIAHCTGFQELAGQLRVEADKFRSATDQERINQVIAHIEKQLDTYQWAKASTLIESLIKAEPESEKARQMRQVLIDKKAERKKSLLKAWDEAIRREATDRGLEILRELDQYLTPNEGLALQEAARDVFMTKLHNLGVQFSLAVSGRQWDKALETGEEIIRGFPNSKMAEEIRGKIDVLKQKALD